MGSVAKRRCARGAACYQVRVLQLEEPPKLRATRQSNICEKCEEELAGGEEPLQEHKELFRAARALLDNGIENELEIIPTLVLAANVGQMPHLELISDELAKAGRAREARSELVDELYSVFGGLVMSSGRVVDGVPLVQRTPVRISVIRDKNEAGGTLPPMGESSGDENANLYMRGVNEGRSGELLEAPDLLDILEVFGEDGMRSYLMGIIEGEEDAAEDEEDGEDQE